MSKKLSEKSSTPAQASPPETDPISSQLGDDWMLPSNPSLEVARKRSSQPCSYYWNWATSGCSCGSPQKQPHTESPIHGTWPRAWRGPKLRELPPLWQQARAVEEAAQAWFNPFTVHAEYAEVRGHVSHGLKDDGAVAVGNLFSSAEAPGRVYAASLTFPCTTDLSVGGWMRDVGMRFLPYTEMIERLREIVAATCVYIVPSELVSHTDPNGVPLLFHESRVEAFLRGHAGGGDVPFTIDFEDGTPKGALIWGHHIRPACEDAMREHQSPFETKPVPEGKLHAGGIVGEILTRIEAIRSPSESCRTPSGTLTPAVMCHLMNKILMNGNVAGALDTLEISAAALVHKHQPALLPKFLNMHRVSIESVMKHVLYNYGGK